MPSPLAPDIEAQAIALIRGFAMDAPLRANSGHQGTAMALAPLANVLYSRILKHDPADPGVARPRPLRAVQRARLDPPVLAAVPVRLRPRARRHRGVPPVRVAHARPPRGAPHPGHRGHDRAARPGLRRRRRHGDRRARAARAVRHPPRRPPHVRHRRRRVLHGGRQPRGGLARRPPRPRPADLRVRRQPGHDRRHDRAVELRRRRPALRGLRLARRVPRRDRRRLRRPRGRPASRPAPTRRARRCSCCARTSARRRPTTPTTRRPTATRSRPRT